MSYDCAPGRYPQNPHPALYESTSQSHRRKKSYMFIWPRDGKQDHSTWGRLKDVLRGKGPDVFVNISDRPVYRQRGHSLWLDPDIAGIEKAAMPWARRDNMKYNFRTRWYEEQPMQMDPFSGRVHMHGSASDIGPAWAKSYHEYRWMSNGQRFGYGGCCRRSWYSA